MNDMYVYDSAFQNMAATGSAYAASQIISIVQSVMPVQSVLDVGCARGTWLRQWIAQGTDDVVGVDGDYVDRERLEIAAHCFVAHDLAESYDLHRRFDLAQSLEVAEHLPRSRAASFVADLVAHAPAVLFSAAPPGQGGEHHINEQPSEYWRQLFRAHDYVAIDCLRPLLRHDSQIPPWYRFNLMLYVQRSELWKVAPFARRFQIADEEPIADTSPLGYRLRKHVVRLLPRALCDGLARWNARRYPDAETMADVARGSPERFGYSWDRYADVLPEHEEQFLRWTGLDRSCWQGVRFLDAGCGIGRNSYWPTTYGAASGLAVDVDDRTLARARANLAPFPNMEVRRQSIYEISESDVFDIVFSIGVVHHLSEPDAAVARMARAAKPGGLVLVWLYGRENNGWIVHLFNPLRRLLFSRLPLRLVHALSWPLTGMLWCVLRLGLLTRPYYRLIRGFSFEHLRAIVFDHMIPRIALYYTRAEAEALLARAGLTEIRATAVNENSWSVTGRKHLD